jgi:hypothetical protein
MSTNLLFAAFGVVPVVLVGGLAVTCVVLLSFIRLRRTHVEFAARAEERAARAADRAARTLEREERRAERLAGQAHSQARVSALDLWRISLDDEYEIPY